MKALIADVESNGKPLRRGVDFRDVDNWPRITQIAWLIVDTDTGEYTHKNNFMIYPDCWEVPTEQFFIDNNMSTERCIKEGTPLPIVLDIFKECINECDVMVFHNKGFDFNVIAAEMIRYNVTADKVVPKICTMLTTIDFCNIPGMYGKAKYPKLEELHMKLFGVNFENSHDAFADVEATARCYSELVRLGHYDNNNEIVNK